MTVRMRATRSHTRNRRSHHALKGERLSADKKTGTVHPRHRALLDGSTYRGRTVMDTTKKGKTVAEAPKENKEKVVEKKEEAAEKKEDEAK